MSTLSTVVNLPQRRLGASVAASDQTVLQGAIHLLAVLEQSSLGNMESCGLVGCLRSSSRGTNPVNYFMDPEDHEDLGSNADFELELSRVTFHARRTGLGCNHQTSVNLATVPTF